MAGQERDLNKGTVFNSLTKQYFIGWNECVLARRFDVYVRLGMYLQYLTPVWSDFYQTDGRISLGRIIHGTYGTKLHAATPIYSKFTIYE